jgi:multiple sugar transport system substrate-binding protein
MDGSLATEGYKKADGTSNMDSPFVKNYLQKLYDLMHVDKTTPTLGEQLTSKMPTETMFLKGQASIFNAGDFIFQYSNNLKNYPRDFKIAFAPPPKLSKDQTNYRIFGGLGDTISINPRSEHAPEAWKFLKWYADGGMMPMAKGGRIPASASVNRDDAIKLLLTGTENTYDVESLKKVFFSNLPKYTQNLEQQVIDLRKDEYEKYFINNQTLDQTIQNIMKRHNEFLKNKK